MPERANDWRKQAEVTPSGAYKVWSVREIEVSGVPTLKVSWQEAGEASEENYSADAAIDTYVRGLDDQKEKLNQKRLQALGMKNT